MPTDAELAVKAQWPEAVCELCGLCGRVEAVQFHVWSGETDRRRKYHDARGRIVGVGHTPEEAWEDARKRMGK